MAVELVKKAPVGATLGRPWILPMQNPSPQGENTVIFLRTIRKTTFFGGRARLAQTEHYTTAAARLGISQPALSSAIHNLENALGGVKLFEKVGRNIRLTDEGRFYQENVDEAIQKLHSASMILRESRTQAPIVIRMGVVSGTLDGFLAREIVKYTRKNKRIRFHLTEF